MQVMDNVRPARGVECSLNVNSEDTCVMCLFVFDRGTSYLVKSRDSRFTSRKSKLFSAIVWVNREARENMVVDQSL